LEASAFTSAGIQTAALMRSEIL